MVDVDLNAGFIVPSSVSDPFHFDMKRILYPRIRFVKYRILLQIRPKIGKISTFFSIKKYFSEIWSVLLFMK